MNAPDSLYKALDGGWSRKTTMKTTNTREPKNIRRRQEATRSIQNDRMDPLGTLIPWIAAMGILGLLGVTLLERLVPILPSTALLVALGVAVGEGHWSLSMAFWSSTAGSLLGCLSFYGLGLTLGEARSFAVLDGSARFFGISQGRLRRLIIYFRRYERTMIFGSQLIPSVRLIAPAIAGLLRARPREFLMATTLGVALWNSLLIGVGYAAALTNDSANTSAAALKIVLVVLAGEVVVAAAWRSIVVWRGSRGRCLARATNKQISFRS
jgi:membrane protein DedA with SNARE-associated domain